MKVSVFSIDKYKYVKLDVAIYIQKKEEKPFQYNQKFICAIAKDLEVRKSL